MRFSEILLLNAEAKLESGAGAVDVATSINKVRNRVGMPSVDGATLQMQQL
jgi:spore germination cell wall hydrolase CwlJ-like protein